MGLNQQNRRGAYIVQSSVEDGSDGSSQPEIVKMRDKKKPLRNGNQVYRFRPLSTNSIASTAASYTTPDPKWRNSHVSSAPSTASGQASARDPALMLDANT
ncbi:unnamed protein product [Enterobius vermicularis]|uniref:DUF4005 domain-containing protein n=1 Tax=Enterobius vermicularis TaxID=51028 RepID=A0A0N4VMB7_ENTVE|nr:unnamed protein product [Enterobius vermicularis]